MARRAPKPLSHATGRMLVRGLGTISGGVQTAIRAAYGAGFTEGAMIFGAAGIVVGVAVARSSAPPLPQLDLAALVLAQMARDAAGREFVAPGVDVIDALCNATDHRGRDCVLAHTHVAQGVPHLFD